MRLAALIRAQTQPNPHSCTATCVAMALGVPVSELGVKLDRPWDFGHFGVWLAERGIWLRPMLLQQGLGERYHQGCLYLVGVRSLNAPNQDHAVLLDTRGARREGEGFNERSGWLTFDPNAGIEGKRLYDWADEHLTLDACQLIDREMGAYFAAVGGPP